MACRISNVRQVRVDRGFGTLVWPNGVDFCPEALHDEAEAIASAIARP